MKNLIVSSSTLNGKVIVSGAKNSVLRLLAASILSQNKITLTNYPSMLLDAQIHVGMLNRLGKKCSVYEDKIVIEEARKLNSTLHWEDRSIRNTLLILGALTARTGAAAVPLPGGCNLGDRAYDLHVMLLERLGARVWEEGNMLCTEAPAGGLIGANIYLPIRSTGATENALIAGSLASGVTRIWNPHIRPEIIDLVNFLNLMGAKITVFGQEHIQIIGVDGLNGLEYKVMSDNMEAITWLIGAVMTDGDVEIEQFPYNDLEVALIHLKESGAKFYRGENNLIVRGGRCYPLEISTGPHPSINSDVQPIMAAYAACAHGKSCIVDLRFRGRYGYAAELAKMGLDYTIEDNMLTIKGTGKKLHGAEVRALDLRAGVALTLCGMTASGETKITDAWQIERGYNNFVDKLKTLGGNICIE